MFSRRRSPSSILVLSSFVLALVCWLSLRPAAADTRRVAVVIGHNTGGPTERPLRYAEDDAAKLADVLVELGDVDRSRLFLVRGKNSAAVVEALGRATEAVKASRQAPDDRVVLTFFFSGHSNATALQLGDSSLTYVELKRLLELTGAEVRLTIVDGCKSGGLVAAKGGKAGPAFEIGLTDQLSSTGVATLTSSAADEASLESSEIRGSFFTHHLVSGLRGAADASGDGRVTLSEAYEYAFNRTVVASAAAGSAPQHPNYEYQLSGGGELVLTRVGERSASLRLPAGFSRALVINVLRDQVIAELTRDEVRVLAVAPGEYAVRLWKASAAYVGRVKATANNATAVTWEQLEAAPLPGSASKGESPVFDGGDRFAQPMDAPLSPEAQLVYDAEMLSVGDSLVIRKTGAGASASVQEADSLYEGRYRRKISPEQFLRRVGLPERAEQVKARRKLQRSIFTVGAVMGGASAAYGMISLFGELDFPIMPGLVVGALGLGVAASPLFMETYIPRPDELRELADRHNQALRERLRGGAGAGSKPAPITARLQLQLAPVVTTSGGGLTLVGRF